MNPFREILGFFLIVIGYYTGAYIAALCDNKERGGRRAVWILGLIVAAFLCGRYSANSTFTTAFK